MAAAGCLQHVRAYGTYLHTAVGTPRFGETASHVRAAIIDLINGVVFDTTEVQAIVSELARSPLPIPMQGEIHRQLSTSVRDAHRTTRSPLQDFRAIPFYLCDKRWDTLESDQPNHRGRKDEFLVSFLINDLKGTHPNEPTVQTLTALSLYSSEGTIEAATNLAPDFKLAYMKEVKRKIKRARLSLVEPSVSGCSILPTDVEFFRLSKPELYASAYPDGGPVPPRMDMTGFSVLVNSIPMRSSNIAMRPLQVATPGPQRTYGQHNAMGAQQPADMMQFMMQFMAERFMSMQSGTGRPLQDPTLRFSPPVQQATLALQNGPARSTPAAVDNMDIGRPQPTTDVVESTTSITDVDECAKLILAGVVGKKKRIKQKKVGKKGKKTAKKATDETAGGEGKEPGHAEDTVPTTPKRTKHARRRWPSWRLQLRMTSRTR
jgi:hypothetical protein